MTREFHLSPHGKGGVSCDADGAFIGAIPILDRLRNGDEDEWCLRDCDELSKQVGEHYGLPIDMSSKTGGLTTIAKALNEGDVARAQIAAVLLGIPDPPPLSKGNPSRDQMIKLIRDLHWSGMIKADWDADAISFDLAVVSNTGAQEKIEEIIAKAGYNPDEPRDEHGRWTNGGGSAEPAADDRSTRIQLADAGMSDAYNDPVAEAVRAAARYNSGAANSPIESVGNDKQSFWETLGSGLSHKAKSALLQIGRAQADQSYVNFNEAGHEADVIAHGLRAYAEYRAKPWIGPDDRPVQIPVYYTGNPYWDGVGFLRHELFEPNTPSTRPGTNADWLDPLINAVSLATIVAGPAVRLTGVAAESLDAVALPAAESDELIGNSGFRSINEFSDAAAAKYQGFYDQGYSIAIQRARAGLIAKEPLVIGNETDAFARYRLQDWLTSEGIPEGPGEIIQVNRRLYDPLGSGDYRVPDVYIPGSRTILDGSLQFKTSSMAQITDFRLFSGGAKVLIIRPSAAPQNLVWGSYGIVY